MNTWILLLFAFSSTIVKSYDYQGSTSSPEVIRKGYTPRSWDQIQGESSPRAIFIYPPNGGSDVEGSSRLQHEGSDHILVNRPGVLHSRYVAGPRERDSSKNSQINTFSLQPLERSQEYKNNQREDSILYRSSSNSASHHSSPHLDNHQDHRSDHSDNHQDHRSHHPDNHQYHSIHHSDNPQNHSSHHSDNHQDHSSNHSDNPQDHSSHHSGNPKDHNSHHPYNHQDHSSTHPHNHQDYNSHHSDNRQDHSSHHSSNLQEHRSHHSANLQDHSGQHSGNPQDHSSHHLGNPKEHNNYHPGNPQDHSSHHSSNLQDDSGHYSGNSQDHSNHHSGNLQDHRGRHSGNPLDNRSHTSGNPKDHNSHQSGNPKGHSSHHPGNHQDQLPSESDPRPAYVQVPHDGGRKEPHKEQEDGFQFHNSRNKPSPHNSLLPKSNDQYFSESAPHVTYALPPSVGNHKLSLDRKTEDIKYFNSKDRPSLVLNGVSPNPREQSPVGSSVPATFSHPNTGVYNGENIDLQQINLKYHNPTSNPSVSNYYGFPSNRHDRTSSNTNYETQQGSLNYNSSKSNHSSIILNRISSNPQDQYSEERVYPGNSVHSLHEGNLDQIHDKQQNHFKYESPTSSSLVAFQSSISSNHHDKSTGLSSRHHPNGETNEKDRKNNPNDLKYTKPTYRPSMGFHSDYSINMYDETGAQGNLFRSSQRELNSENKKDLENIDHPSPSSVTHHNGIPSKPNDQSSGESVIPTVIILPHHKKNYWETPGSHQEYLGFSTPSIPLTTVHEGYKANGQFNPIQSADHVTPQAQHPFEENYKKTEGLTNQNPTLSPPNVLQNNYQQITYDDTRDNDHNKYKTSQLTFGENHESINKQLDHFRYEDITDFPKIQKDSLANPRVRTPDKVQDHTRYHHGDDTRIRSETEHNVHSQMYESKIPFRDSTALPQAEHENHASKHHNTRLIGNQPESKHHKSESHGGQDIPKHNVIHHEYSDYVPYRGPYTKPQVLHDRPNTHEIASVTVEPFGTPKAQPPKEFQLSSTLNSHYPAEHTSRNVQTDSFKEKRENQNYNKNRRNYGISENGYSQFSPQDVYNYSTETSKYQWQQPNETQTKNYPVTVSPQIYEGYIQGNNYSDNYSFGNNNSQETYIGSPSQYSYAKPFTSSQTVQDTLNSYTPLNYAVNEQIHSAPSLQTKPSYPYEGEYVNHLGSNDNAYHTVNQLGSTPQVSVKNTTPQVLHYTQNSTNSNGFLPITNHQTPTNYQIDGSYIDRYSSELIKHSKPYQEQNVRQDLTHIFKKVPVPNYQVIQDAPNNTNSEYAHAVVRHMNNEEHFNENGNRYSTEHNIDTRIQQKYTSQAHTEDFTNQQLWKSAPLSNSPLVTSTPENFTPARTVQVSEGQDSILYTKNHPSVDHLNPGVHHEYALKFSFNKPILTPQPFNFIPNSNHSEHLAIYPAPPTYVGHLESKNQHSSGLVGLIDPQHVYAPHVPYHALPAVKPLVLQTEYQEDTHEISHAKYDHLHVHHSSQSGYQYGIIN